MGFEVLVSRIVLLMMLTGLSTGLVFGQDRSVVAANRRHRNFLEQRQTIFQNLKFELGKVGDWCHDNNLPHLGDEITQLSLNLTSDNAGMLPARTVVLPVEVTLPEKELRCRTQVAQLRINRARDLYILARKTLRMCCESILTISKLERSLGSGNFRIRCVWMTVLMPGNGCHRMKLPCAVVASLIFCMSSLAGSPAHT